MTICGFSGMDEYIRLARRGSGGEFGENAHFCKLELEVTVYNINKGRNEELAKRSEKLKGYEFFIYLVKEYLKAGMDRSSAIRRAVLDCIRQDVLKEFFEEHGSEVHNMLLSEWNIDDAKRVWQREAREDGIGIGVMQTVRNMLCDGVEPALVARYTNLPLKAVKALR